jgi:hypothetical protein
MQLSHLGFVVLFYLAAGTYVSLGFLRQNEVGRSYYLCHGLPVTLLAGLAYVFLGYPFLDLSAKIWFLGFIASSAIYSATAGRWRWLSRGVYPIGVVTALMVIVRDVEHTLPDRMLGTAPFPYVIANAVLSTCLLGFAVAALLLGHWYLVKPRLSIGELSRLTSIVMLLLVTRLAFGTFFFLSAIRGKTEVEIFRYVFSTTPGIFLLMRWAWGLLGPLGLSSLVWLTVRNRSNQSATQSATGILYITVFCILAGETLSQYLAFFHAIPL